MRKMRFRELRLFISGERTSKQQCKPVSVEFPAMSLPVPGNSRLHSILSLSRSLAAEPPRASAVSQADFHWRLRNSLSDSHAQPDRKLARALF